MKKVRLLANRTANGLRKNKLYRFTNKEENHHGHQYQTGLNTDSLHLDTLGDCCSGGLYFFEGDPIDRLMEAERYLSPMYIRLVTLPAGEPVVRNDHKYRARSIILGERILLTDYLIQHRHHIELKNSQRIVLDIFQRIHGHEKGSKLFVEKFCDGKPWDSMIFDLGVRKHFVRKKILLKTISVNDIFPIITCPGIRNLVMKSLAAGALVGDLHSWVISAIAMTDDNLFVKLIQNSKFCPTITRDLCVACAINPKVFTAILDKYGKDSRDVREIRDTISGKGFMPARIVKRMQKEVAAHA